MSLLVSAEVSAALDPGRAIVALETSVIGQGLPHPRNLECVERMSGAIRGAGAVPAWIGLLDGAVVVGLAEAQLRRFATGGEAVKVARRDVPAVVAGRRPGATTVGATIWAARRAGIPVVATGGMGGVHPGPRPDVSADLFELAVTPVLLVCSGPKSIVDPVATAERLEELGVSLVGYRVDRLPWFLAREAPVDLAHRVETQAEAAELVRAQRSSGVEGAIVLCNPVPADVALDPSELSEATRRAQERMSASGVTGKDVTPFLLSELAEETGGRSLEANLALLEANALLAAEVAVALSGARSG